MDEFQIHVSLTQAGHLEQAWTEIEWFLHFRMTMPRESARICCLVCADSIAGYFCRAAAALSGVGW